MSGRGQERLVDLDLLRLLAIVLVVASHLIPPAETPLYHALRLLGILGVAVFFFISGYLLQRGYPSIATSPDTRLFFHRRAWRIFPLYWVALLFALLVGHLIDEAGGVIGPGDLLAHVLGLQMILYPSYITVLAFWFIGSIVLFYLLYPLLVYRDPSVGGLLLRGLAIFLVMGIVRAVAGLFGGGIFTDFPVFVLGIAAGMTDFLQSDRFRSWRLILAVVAVPAIGVAYLTLASDGAAKWGGEISLSLVLSLGSVAVYLLAGLCSIFLCTGGICLSRTPISASPAPDRCRRHRLVCRVSLPRLHLLRRELPDRQLARYSVGGSRRDRSAALRGLLLSAGGHGPADRTVPATAPQGTRWRIRPSMTIGDFSANSTTGAGGMGEPDAPAPAGRAMPPGQNARP